jgi:hypothetical protein
MSVEFSATLDELRKMDSHQEEYRTRLDDGREAKIVFVTYGWRVKGIGFVALCKVNYCVPPQFR